LVWALPEILQIKMCADAESGRVRLRLAPPHAEEAAQLLRASVRHAEGTSALGVALSGVIDRSIELAGENGGHTER
jgi:hypothetical protein